LSSCARIDEIDSEMVALRRRQARVSPGPDEAIARSEAVESSVVVEELCKVFHAEKDGKIGKNSVVALSNVTLHVRQGESVALVGESGSGKTTLARCLVGLEKPTSGRMQIGDIDASDQNKFGREDSRRLRNLVQYVFQDPYSSLNPTKTIGATLAEAASLRLGRDREAVRDRVDELLSIVGLTTDYRERKPVALSGGERQRVAIARALALEPRVIICDEPVSALDVSVQAQVLDLLNQIRVETGVSYLFITHDLAVVRQVAERVYVLRKGELVETGSVDELLEHPKDQYTQELLAAVPGQWDRDSGLVPSD
jgi:peptide/nickel transport system ATP-binding protein